MPRVRRLIVCARCQRERNHCGRQLCEACHQHCRKAGTLDDYERARWPREELLAEWEWLARQGYDRAGAAERLGIRKGRLEKALERERKQVAS